MNRKTWSEHLNSFIQFVFFSLYHWHLFLACSVIQHISSSCALRFPITYCSSRVTLFHTTFPLCRKGVELNKKKKNSILNGPSCCCQVTSHSNSTSASAVECLENIYFENLKILGQKNFNGRCQICLLGFRSACLKWSSWWHSQNRTKNRKLGRQKCIPLSVQKRSPSVSFDAEPWSKLDSTSHCVTLLLTPTSQTTTI